MPLTAAERKRKSRASNPERNSNEKEKSRKRMAIYRSKNRSQKKALAFKALLSDGETKELETQSANHMVSLLSDWLISRGHNFSAATMVEKNIVNLFVPKIEMHKIERQVAEFEIDLAQKLLCAPSKPADTNSMADGCVGGECEETSASLPMAARIAGEEDLLYQEIRQIPTLPPLIPSIVSISDIFDDNQQRQEINPISQDHQGQNYNPSVGGNTEEGKSYPDVGDEAAPDGKDHRSCQYDHEHALDALLIAAERMESGEGKPLAQKH
mmetsp:Transcript_15910/g.33610  ORF Transcript_15910/g.33610 Transcript_15910/m.33610 type:complete len:269 (-) Transcript_15910:84-890(-)